MADDSKPERPPRKRGPGRPFPPGVSGNPGGKPRWKSALEKILDDEHRTPEELRETMNIVRNVARGVDTPVFHKGEICGYVRKYDSGWMELYLNRVIGPVKDLEIDLTDAPEDVVRWLAEQVN